MIRGLVGFFYQMFDVTCTMGWYFTFYECDDLVYLWGMVWNECFRYGFVFIDTGCAMNIVGKTLS